MKNMKNVRVIVGMTLGMFALLLGLAKLGGGSADKPQTLKKIVAADEHVRGPINAPVTLVEYSDFQCPACKTIEASLRRLSGDFDQELRIVYRNYPLTALHKNALAAAYASEAASLQGRFWEYHDILFNTQDQWSSEADPTAKFLDYAKTLGLDEAKFTADMKSDVVKNKITADMKEGDAENISGTPSFFLNGNFFKVPASYEGFNAAIVEQLILTGNNGPAEGSAQTVPVTTNPAPAAPTLPPITFSATAK